MNRFTVQESLVAEFISALNEAGMQRGYANDPKKPYYWRGFVPKDYSTRALFLRYNVDENNTAVYADDDDFMRSIEIGGEVYTNNGYGDSAYQDLCIEIENKLKEHRFIIEWLQEDTDASFNVDAPISIKRFTVTKNKV